MKNEIWKPVKGYEGRYEVSNFGRVKSLKSKIILKPHLQKWGYYSVTLYKNNNRKHEKIHRLVAIHFIPNPNNKRTVNHIDLCKTNNRVSNLEWATDIENIRHSYEKGNHKRKLTKKEALSVYKMYEQGAKVKTIQAKYGIGAATVRQIAQQLTHKYLDLNPICRTKPQKFS